MDLADARYLLDLYAELAEHFRRQVEFPESATLGLSDEQYLRNIAESLYRKGPGRAGRRHPA